MEPYGRKGNTRILILCIVLIWLGGTAGCTGFNTQRNQTTGSQTSGEYVAIGDLMENPGNYSGQEVTLHGTITSQCGSGCWFFLTDRTGTVYVDLNRANFVLPPAIKSEAVVKGQVLNESSDISLAGTWVRVNGKVYP